MGKATFQNILTPPDWESGKSIVHKCLAKDFLAIANGERAFRGRIVVSQYKEGDYLLLREWEPDEEYTGQTMNLEITSCKPMARGEIPLDGVSPDLDFSRLLILEIGKVISQNLFICDDDDDLTKFGYETFVAHVNRYTVVRVQCGANDLMLGQVVFRNSHLCHRMQTEHEIKYDIQKFVNMLKETKVDLKILKLFENLVRSLGNAEIDIRE